MSMRDWPRHNVTTYQLAAARVEVYRRDDKLVQGPAMSLHVGDVELMRWDLQPRVAHVHWAIGGAPRLYLPRGWPLALLAELACDQLVQHTRVVARMAGVPRPDKTGLRTAAAWAMPQIVERA